MHVIEVADLVPLRRIIESLKKHMKSSEAQIIFDSIDACLEYALKESFEIKEEGDETF